VLQPVTKRTLGWGFAAAAWSAAYGGLGLLWALGAPGFPFGRDADRSAVITLFPGAQAWPGGLVIAVLGAVGAVFAGMVAVADLRGRPARWAAWPASIVAVALIAVVPDYRVLLVVAYLPLVVLGAPFGWPPDVDLSLILPWPVLNQFVLIAGGALWAGMAVEARGTNADWSWLRRIGPAATAVAVAVPLVYAATRYAWAAGFPIGLSPDFYRRGQEIGLWTIGAALATVAVLGAILTLGLIQDWGTRFPRWMPFIGGRPVPSDLAVVPALAAAFTVTSAGLMFVRLVAGGRLGEAFVFADEVGWTAIAPELIWPLWGIALALAAFSYRERRRRSG
jgi:hypothetical protein